MDGPIVKSIKETWNGFWDCEQDMDDMWYLFALKYEQEDKHKEFLKKDESVLTEFQWLEKNWYQLEKNYG
jgi:hypothetical protein